MTVDAATTVDRVSVVVPHYGDAEPTRRLIDDLVGQAFEIVVVDDCSPTPFPEVEGVTVVRRPRNGGFGTTVNAGARAATGELLLILNSDLRVDADFVTRLVDASAPWQPAITGPNLVNPDGSSEFSPRRLPTIGHQVVEWLTPLSRFRHTTAWHRGVGHDLDALAAERPVPVDWLVGAALLIPRRVFLDAGGFDERYFMNCEEVDLQRRLHEVGIPSVFLPSVRAVHEGGGSSDPAKRRRWVAQSRLSYAAKWGGLRRLRAGLRAASVVNLVANGTRRLAGRGVAPLRTFAEEWSLTRGRP